MAVNYRVDVPIDADFRWMRGDNQKHASLSLWRTWFGSNGYEIWQGRPYVDRPREFVYRLAIPNGNTEDHRLLNDAKRRGRTLHLYGFRGSPQAVAAVDPVDAD